MIGFGHRIGTFVVVSAVIRTILPVWSDSEEKFTTTGGGTDVR